MGMGPRLAAATLLAVASGPVGGAAVLAADEVPYNSKLELNGGGRAFEGTDGYLTLGGLAGIGLDPDYEQGLGFVELQGHQLLEGDRAYNATLGYRWADWSDGTVWGVNAGLSGRSKDGDWYTWCNVGVERLSPDFDLRANGYLLCGEGEHDARCEPQRFAGNSLLVATRADLGMQGFDLSIGAGDSTLIPGTELYGQAEFYWFTAAYGEDALGGRAALDWQVHDNIALSGWVSYDTLFETSGLVGITVSLGGPTHRRDRAADSLGTGERLVSFVERRNLMAIHEDALDSGGERPLTDADGQPLPFWHVDNTAAPGGDGTWEQPFDTLAAAGAEAGTTGPGDVIIFHVGDGTTTNQTDGITLQDSQYFLAGGFDRTLGFGDCDCTLAELLDEGRPVMTDSDGDALRLADDNVTGGYDIVDAAQQGVSGDGIVGLAMFDVGIYDSGGSGIELTNSTGRFLFSGLTVTGNDGDFPVDDAGGGFNLLGIAGQVVIEDTLCSENGVNGGPLSRYDCIEIASAAAGDLDVAIRRTRVLDNWGNGLELHLTGSGRMSALVEDSLFQRNSESAITLVNDVNSTGAARWELRGNGITDNGWSGVEVSKLLGTNTLQLLIEDNLIADNTTLFNFDPQRSAGIALSLRGTTSDVVIRGNSIAGHDAAGIYGAVPPQTPGGALVRILVEDNDITGNGFGRDDDQTGGILVLVSSRDRDFANNPIPVEVGQAELTVRGNLLEGNARVGAELFGTIGVVGLNTSPAPLGCVNYQGNSGGGALVVNSGVDRSQRISAVTVRMRDAGGDLALDPASSGNSQPVTQLGAIASRGCEAVQAF